MKRRILSLLLTICLITSICAFMPIGVGATEFYNVIIDGYCYNTLGQNVASTAFLYSTQDEYLGSVYSGYNQSFFTLECNITNNVIPEYIVFTADVGNHSAEGVYYITEQDIQHFIDGKSISISCPVYIGWKFNVNDKTPNDLSKYIDNTKIDLNAPVLTGDFSEFVGIYEYTNGYSFELLANGLRNLDIPDVGTEFHVEDITKETDGAYTWSINCVIRLLRWN